MKTILPLGTANAFTNCKEVITKNAFDETERVKMMKSFYRISKQYPILLRKNTKLQGES